MMTPRNPERERGRCQEAERDERAGEGHQVEGCAAARLAHRDSARGLQHEVLGQQRVVERERTIRERCAGVGRVGERRLAGPSGSASGLLTAPPRYPDRPSRPPSARGRRRRDTSRGGTPARAHRVGGTPDGLVRQEELAQFFAEVGALGHRRVRESLGGGVRVRVVGALRAPARPEARAAQLVRVSLEHDAVGAVGSTARVPRSRATGEPGDRQIHRAPEVVDGAHLAHEARPEQTELPVGVDQLLPEGLGMLRVVGAVRGVVGERDGDGDLVGHGMDLDRHPERAQCVEGLRVEGGDRLPRQGERTPTAVARAQHEFVLDEVELDVEDARRRRDGAGARGRERSRRASHATSG